MSTERHTELELVIRSVPSKIAAEQLLTDAGLTVKESINHRGYWDYTLIYAKPGVVMGRIYPHRASEPLLVNLNLNVLKAFHPEWRKVLEALGVF